MSVSHLACLISPDRTYYVPLADALFPPILQEFLASLHRLHTTGASGARATVTVCDRSKLVPPLNMNDVITLVLPPTAPREEVPLGMVSANGGMPRSSATAPISVPTPLPIALPAEIRPPAGRHTMMSQPFNPHIQDPSLIVSSSSPSPLSSSAPTMSMPISRPLTPQSVDHSTIVAASDIPAAGVLTILPAVTRMRRGAPSPSSPVLPPATPLSSTSAVSLSLTTSSAIGHAANTIATSITPKRTHIRTYHGGVTHATNPSFLYPDFVPSTPPSSSPSAVVTPTANVSPFMTSLTNPNSIINGHNSHNGHNGGNGGNPASISSPSRSSSMPSLSPSSSSGRSGSSDRTHHSFGDHHRAHSPRSPSTSTTNTVAAGTSSSSISSSYGNGSPLVAAVTARLNYLAVLERIRTFSLRQVFVGMDHDRDGIVSHDEVRQALRAHGWLPYSSDEEAELTRLIAPYSDRQPGYLSYAEFVSFVQLRKNGGVELPTEPPSPRSINNTSSSSSHQSHTRGMGMGIAAIANGNGESAPSTPRSGRASRIQSFEPLSSSSLSSSMTSASSSSPNVMGRIDTSNMIAAGGRSQSSMNHTSELIGGIRRSAASSTSGNVTPLLTGTPAIVAQPPPPPSPSPSASSTSAGAPPPFDVSATSSMASLPSRTIVTVTSVDELIRVIASAIHSSSLRTVRAAFDYFDRDHRQLISMSNCRDALSLLSSSLNLRAVHVTDTIWQQLYDRYDTDHTGTLSISAFSRLLTGK